MTDKAKAHNEFVAARLGGPPKSGPPAGGAVSNAAGLDWVLPSWTIAAAFIVAQNILR